MKYLIILFIIVFSQLISCDTTQNRCHHNEFKCLNSKECIDRIDLCDGTKNCRDGSDETLSVCAQLIGRCPEPFYQCSYGGCVKDFIKCGEKVKCPANVERESCACGNNRYTCKSGSCITINKVCDGFADCDDSSDETSETCTSKVCEKGQFKCKYGGCIKGVRKCDAIIDCDDGSDEDEEACNSHIPFYALPETDNSATQGLTATAKPSTLLSSSASSTDGCLIPPKPEGGDHKIVGCEGADCYLRPGEKVGPLTKLNFMCSKGYVLSEKYQSSYCSPPSYTWDPEPPKCLRTCKSLASESLDLECFFKGSMIPCNSTILPGTILRARCKSAYYLADPAAAFNETYCLIDGNWEKHLFHCNIYCGTPFVVGAQATIAGGSKTKIGQFPWHAGLYFKTPTGFEKPGCGGSVISPYAIISAAHCIYYAGTSLLREPETVKIAVGKYWGDWNHHEQFEQKKDVKELIPHANYEGDIDKYLYDIALISLKESITMNNIVHPICMDWQKNSPPKAGEIGLVSGWGATLKSIRSEELQFIALKYMPHKICREKVSKNYSPYITIDKFCSENEEGKESGVLQGDSGGGYSILREENRYYLYGIVSVKPDTNYTEDRRIAGFTSVSFHLNWIQNIESRTNEVRRMDTQKKGIVLTYK